MFYYMVKGPLGSQGRPPPIYQAFDLEIAYAIMIKLRQLIGKKTIHVYSIDDDTIIKICRQCQFKISRKMPGCPWHSGDEEIISSGEDRIKQFDGLDPSKYIVTADINAEKTIFHNIIVTTAKNEDNSDRNSDDNSNDTSKEEEEYNSDDSVTYEDLGIQTVEDAADIAPNHEERALYRPISSHNKEFRCLIGSEIVLEGLIGIGKSTLGSSLQCFLEKIGLKVKFFPEFVDDPFLSLYLSNMEKYAFAFQVVVARERLRIYREAREFSSNGGISIIDRSLIGDLTFATMQHEKGFITDEEWIVYKGLVGSPQCDEPFITMYLDGGPEQAYQRMLKRSNASEVDGYDLKYFQDLNAAYQIVLSTVNTEVIKVPWGSDKMMMDGMVSDDGCVDFLKIIRKHIIG